MNTLYLTDLPRLAVTARAGTSLDLSRAQYQDAKAPEVIVERKKKNA